MNPQSTVEYDGSEGELYNVVEDPYQFRNLWNDPDHRRVRDDLVADLYDHLPPARRAAVARRTPRVTCRVTATRSSSGPSPAR